MSRAGFATIVLGLTLALGVGAHGQISSTITGVVQDPLGLAVANVGVDVGGGVASGITDLTGLFSIPVPAGIYDVAFTPPSSSSLLPAGVSNVLAPFLGVANMGTIVLQAGFHLTGAVLTSLGAPLFGADINVYDQTTGTKLNTPNDSTDIFGNFDVVVPAGTYRVRARPPAGQVLVAQELQNVVVSGPTVVPTFMLEPGVVLTGVVRDSQTMAAIQGVDLDVDDAVTGQRIITPNDETDASGTFTVIVPVGVFNITFEPLGALAHVARRILAYSVPSSVLPVSMGTILLDQGLVLSGTVMGPGGQPVVGADIDVDTALGNVRVLTPGDNTDANGNFAVVVPADTYTVTVQTPAGSGIVGASLTPVAVFSNTVVPTFNLQAGVTLSGTILAWNGLPEVDADIDVMNPVTGDEIVLTNDDTDASGIYSVTVPAGTWDVRIRTAKLSFSRDATISGVAVGAMPVTLNHTLSIVPVGVYVGPDQQGPFVQGASVPLTVAWFSPLPGGQATTVELKLRDPAGVESTIVPALPLLVPGNQLFLLPLVSIPLPPVNPAHAGLPFQFVLRFRDAVTGQELDSDRSRFIIQ